VSEEQMTKQKSQPSFNVLLVDEGMTSAIEFFGFNSGYGFRNTGEGGLHLTTVLYEILEVVQELDVQWRKRKKASNPNYLDIPMKLKLDKLHRLIAELGAIQKELDDEP